MPHVLLLQVTLFLSAEGGTGIHHLIGLLDSSLSFTFFCHKPNDVASDVLVDGDHLYPETYYNHKVDPAAAAFLCCLCAVEVPVYFNFDFKLELNFYLTNPLSLWAMLSLYLFPLQGWPFCFVSLTCTCTFPEVEQVGISCLEKKNPLSSFNCC